MPSNPATPPEASRPHDDPASLALSALSKPAEAFRSAVAAAAEEIRGQLSRAAPEHGAAAALGAFAVGRIDVGRFTALVERKSALDASALGVLQSAADALASLAGADPAALLVLRVPQGSDLATAVRAKYADLGRAFSAARAAAAARAGTARGPEPAAGPARLEFSRWTRRERRAAPPLVVEVDGCDLAAGALAEFMDGGAKIALVVRGPAAPAPLVRLVAPSTHVLQTADATGLAAFAAYGGPGVAAIVPDGCALFAHDPAAGFTLADRLSIRRMPEGEPKAAVGPFSAAQQLDELRQLAAIAQRPAAVAPASNAAPRSAASAPSSPPAPAAPSAPAAPLTPPDPAARLAALLLSAVDVKDLG